MAELVGGALGAAIGALVTPLAPGVGAWKGFQIGAALGSLYSAVEQSNQSFRGSRLDDLRITGASQGAPIPIVWGTVRTPGNIIWAPNLEEIESQSGGGGSLGGPTFTNYSYSADIAIEVCEGEIVRFSKIWADSELIYDYNGGTPIWAEYIDPDKVTFYLGTMAQTADPLIVAERTAASDQAPAYIGRAYVVFEDFPWSKFGRTPNFNFEVVRGGATVTLQSIAEELLERLELDPSEFDMSAFSAITVSGYMIPNRMELAGAMTLLLRAFNADIIECDGELRGVLKDVAASFALDNQWLGCTTDGDAAADRFVVTRIQELELPRSVDVRYVSPANDHQQFVQRAVRLVADTQGEVTLDLPLVLTNDHARHIAETTLYEEWEGRTRYATSHPLMYLEIAPGDVGTIVVDGITRTVRVLEQLIGMPGHVELVLAQHDNSVYTQYVEGAAPPAGAEVSAPGLYTIWVQDINALRDDDANSACLYGGASRGGSWVGTAITTNSVPPLNSAWIRNAPFQVGLRSAIGELVTSLAVADPGVWDRTNTVDVELAAGTLSSATEDEVLAGANLCIIGNEILQFATATLIGTNTYRLSTLLRGRRGSEWAIATHSIGSKFAMADNLLAASFPVTSLGLAFNMRVTNGWDLISNEESGTAACRSRMPYAPCNVRGSRDGGDNLTITWDRRSRTAPLGPFAEPPLDETSEMYEVDIMNGMSVARTISSTSPTCTYTAAQQVTDFGGEQTSVSVRVYQVSPGWIRGFAAEATI